MSQSLTLQIRPHWHGDSIDYIDVDAQISGYQQDEEKALAVYYRSVVGIPFAAFDNLKFEDAKGELAVEQRTEDLNVSFCDIQGFVPSREVEGPVSWSYKAYPRVLPEEYRSSPYFDFRAEKGGLNTAGVTFFILPYSGEYDTRILWDLSQMPEGSQGISSYAKGDISALLAVEKIRFSFYAVGLIKSVEDGHFGIYWFDEVPFDIDKAATDLKSLFVYMSNFFEDEDTSYKIFPRRDPFEQSGGGTALSRSFMFGYSSINYPTIDDLFNMLAHEMVHNWPHMDDEPAGIGTWYSEGMAEYYSVVLPYRAGITSLENMKKQIETRAIKYYGCPLRGLSNMDLAKIYWTDRRAQPVPYGRGFFYIANTDAAIRRKTDGKYSVDDIVLGFLRRQRSETGWKPMPKDWVKEVSTYLGEDVQREFDSMVAGDLVIPSEEAFQGLFKVETYSKPLEEGGPELPVFRWSVKVKELPLP